MASPSFPIAASTSFIRTIHAPTPLPSRCDSHAFIFLAGSTSASDWRATLSAQLSQTLTKPITLFNPNRPDWNSTWTESPSFPPFYEQCTWEFAAQELADMIIYNFDPNTQAAITLLELGLWVRSGKCVVCCPEGYWKRGYVQMICRRWEIEIVAGLDELVQRVVTRLEDLGDKTQEQGVILK